MVIDHTRFENPLNTRYSSPEMSYVFSDDSRYSTWRYLWLALMESQQELGLTSITKEMVEELRKNLDNIDYDDVREEETRTRHDVMAHLHSLGKSCPLAYKSLHLGATSCYITDNAELILIKKALDLLISKLVSLVESMKHFVMKYKCLPTLGFTHLQPAQLTTVGKRGCLWLQDIIMDLEDIISFKENLKFRGVKGTTGTQASFLNLFEGDNEKIDSLDNMVALKCGFEKTFIITGQTYTRKVDVKLTSILSSLASSLHKMATDLRILANFKEIEEPFEKSQTGSSAMAYKRNPMRAERLCSLSRYLMSLHQNMLNTHATQWLERTLDDSAIRRISIPEGFLTADAILIIANNIFNGIVVYEKRIEKRIEEELPFMATENIIMEMAKLDINRQETHEKIRILSQIQAQNVKQKGLENNLIDTIKKDMFFEPIHNKIDKIMDPNSFTGRAKEQVEKFVENEVDPILLKLKNYKKTDINHHELRV